KELYPDESVGIVLDVSRDVVEERLLKRNDGKDIIEQRLNQYDIDIKNKDYFIRNKKKKSWYDKENKIIYLDIDNLDRFIYEYGKFVLYSNKFLNVENSPNLKNIYSKFLKDSSKYKYFESIEFEEFFADIFEHYVVIDNIKNQISDFVSCRYLKVQEDYLNKNEIPYFNNENKINSFF
ncbi:hypothetical protein, partial [Sutterella wadsworthensis]|uniref:hypothetical protein n=1 Tax=Sutterella wadsworthensis TaxID=40545 RepID=UPI0032BF9BCA